MAIPQAIVRFLESDTRTKLIAQPQLRGQEGQKITLNLGDEIPVPTTTFGSFGGVGSVGTVPISSFNYKNVGVNIERGSPHCSITRRRSCGERTWTATPFWVTPRS